MKSSIPVGPFVIALLTVSSCVSTRTIPEADYAEPRNYEWVVVETLGGEEFELLNASFRGDSLVGALLRDGRGGPRTAVAIGDLQRVRTKEIDKERSTFLVTGGILFVFLLSWYVNSSLST